MHLTFGPDKLVAFSGLARRLCHQLQLESTSYLAGLWKTTILEDLLWRVEVRVQDGRRVDQRRRVPGRAPSWSCKMSCLPPGLFTFQGLTWKAISCFLGV